MPPGLVDLDDRHQDGGSGVGDEGCNCEDGYPRLDGSVRSSTCPVHSVDKVPTAVIFAHIKRDMQKVYGEDFSVDEQVTASVQFL